ncbi:MAG: tetratricopeptide repeat protein [Candidatus Rifleibacteriota bacterium]
MENNETKNLENLWSDWSNQKTPETAVTILTCLRRNGNSEQAWQFIYECFELFPENRAIKDQHAWMIYDFELTPAKARKNFERIIESAEKILNLKPDSLLEKICVFAATDATKAINKPEKTLQFLEMIDKNSLEKCQREYAGKKIMSWRERWYYACVNALFETENFSECREICLEALKDFPHLIEFQRKAALCLAENGDPNQAIEELKSLINNKNVPWYMNSDLAKIFFDAGEVDKSWQQAVIAAQAKGELKTKVNLFQLMARILLAQGNRDAAASHLCLAAAVRAEQNWGVPESLGEMMAKLNASADRSDSRAILASCRKFWGSPGAVTRATSQEPGKIFLGRLMMKNPTSHFAFISSESFNENIYVKASDIPDELKTDGATISFKTTTSFDAGKNRQSMRAVEIKKA